MKKIFFLALLITSFITGIAQKVEYKKGLIKVNDADYAKLEVKKENFGLTKSFEVLSLAGEKILTAKIAPEFENDPNDNSFLYYRVIFLTNGQEGIFKISSLMPEKAFAIMIGNSGILVNDKLDDSKVMEFIKQRGSTPRLQR